MAIFQIVNNLSSQILKNITTQGFKLQPQILNLSQTKSLWSYVDTAFNCVDADRLKIVGPDRLCAEWVLKNGGAIRTVEDPSRLHKDYNTLPTEKTQFKIKTIDGSGSSIMKIGLDHLRGCNYIDTVVFHKCKHLEPDGLKGIVHLNSTLKVLQVSACDDITDDGLMVIGELKNLNTFKMFQMRYVTNLDKVKQKLSDMLPKCHMAISE